MDRFDYDFENVFEYLDLLPKKDEQFDINYLKSKLSKVLRDIHMRYISIKQDEKFKATVSISKLEDAVKSAQKNLESARLANMPENVISELKQELSDAENNRDKNSEQINMKLRQQLRQIDIYTGKLDELYDQAQKETDFYKVFHLLIRAIIETRFIKNMLARKTSNRASLQIPIEELNAENMKLSAISSIFKTVEDVRRYFEVNCNVLDHVDVENRDMSKYAYRPSSILRYTSGESYQGKNFVGPSLEYLQSIILQEEIPDYKYKIQIYQKPEKIPFDDKVVYKFGTFSYATNITTRGGAKYGLTHDIIGAILMDENEEVSIYHGVIYYRQSDIPEDFYKDIVFSNIVFRNAMKHNFGYMGAVERRNDSQPDDRYSNWILSYKSIDSDEVIRALSFATEKPGQSNLNNISTLADAYDLIDYTLKQAIQEKNQSALPEKDTKEAKKVDDWSQGDN